MHTNLKAVAMFIAIAIYPLTWDGEGPSWEQRCDILYDTVEQLLFTDEQKADLYARLAEQLNANTKFNDAMRIIERAIHACQYPK
jgi:hypothetical protein